jgi:HNH endonuclease
MCRMSPVEAFRMKAEMGIPQHRDTFWDADHIVAVKDGGGECGLENLRTLCIFCHIKRTSDQRKA